MSPESQSTHHASPDRLRHAMVVMRIQEVLWYLAALTILGIFLFFLVVIITEPGALNDEDVLVGMGAITVFCGMGFIFSVGMGVFYEFVARALKQHTHWGWIAGIILSIFELLTFNLISIILGILGLVFLLDANVKHVFQKK